MVNVFLPAGTCQLTICPFRKPIKAVPTGAITEIFPSFMFALSGVTSAMSITLFLLDSFIFILELSLTTSAGEIIFTYQRGFF
jgi:hypothetical protein